MISTLSPSDKIAALAYVDSLAGKLLPPMPPPGKVNIGKPGTKNP